MGEKEKVVEAMSGIANYRIWFRKSVLAISVAWTLVVFFLDGMEHQELEGRDP